MTETTSSAIAIKDLQFCYQKNSPAVLNIPHWGVAKRERVFLHGPSGTGKTTLLNLLAGILVCNKSGNRGSVEILGQPLHKLRQGQRDRWRARHIGVVFQQFNLIPYLSAVDNIKLAARFSGQNDVDQQTQQLLSELTIDQAAANKPAAQLSIGQQQRVAIARSFINQPELLIVDEPTSALDADNRAAFMRLLLDMVLKKDTTLLFVSHDLSLTEGMTRVQALSDFNQAGGYA